MQDTKKSPPCLKTAERGEPKPLRQPEADGQGIIDTVHGIVVDGAHAVFEAALVDGADLFEQHDAVLGESAACGIE